MNSKCSSEFGWDPGQTDVVFGSPAHGMGIRAQ